MNEIINKISSHINDLVFLGKTFSIDENITELENQGAAYIENYCDGNYWRGADIQVVKCSPGSTYQDFTDSIIQISLSIDEPCPSRHPELMTGLINEVQKNADYLDAGNKYAFYGQIAESAQNLELNYQDLDKQTICREIIFNQLRLLTAWRNELSKEEESPSSLDEGWKIYFGYGRNSNQDAMLSDNRCPNAKYMGPATLENFKFIIDQKGYASIEQDPDSIVYGVLWAVSPEDFDRLDLREGLRIGSYRKENIQVTSWLPPFDEKLEAVVYISNRPRGNVPAPGYIEEIKTGMISAGISRQQVAYLYEFLETDNNTKEVLIENKPSEERPFLPKDDRLPFFAYGLFKSNQIAHERLRPYVKKVETRILDGCFLAERDGIPLLGSAEQMKIAPQNFPIYVTQVRGEVITFKPDDARKAYRSISALEPSNVYSWSTVEINSENVNVLVGKNIFRGSQALDNDSWDMISHDPFIGELETMIGRLLEDDERNTSVVELQAAYIMLWTGIERLVALRYSMKKREERDILKHLSENSKIAAIFDETLEKPNSFRGLYSSTKPRDKVSFISGDTEKCLKYLRLIRHNVVHRGKGGFADSDLTIAALGFAHQIFKKLYQF